MAPTDFDNKLADLHNSINQDTSANEKARKVAAVYKMLESVNPHAPLSEFYRYSYTGFFHQDRLSWSRAQLVMVVELAALAGEFAGDHPNRAIAILVSATIFIGLIWILIWRDWEQRDAFRDDLKALHKQYDPSSERAFAQKVDRNQYRWGVGKRVLCAVMGLIMLANIGLSVVACRCPSGWVALCN